METEKVLVGDPEKDSEEHRKKTREAINKIIGVIAAGAFVILLTVGLARVSNWMKSSASAQSAAQVASVAPKCPGVAPTSGEELGADEWKTFNPDGCDIQFVVTRGTVLATGPGLKKPVRVSADNVVPNKENNVYAVYTNAIAEGGTAQWLYIKCPKGTMIIGEWRCRS